MILGIGTDIVDISRISRLYRRYGDSFLEKFMSPDERACIPVKRADEFIAGRFAAKESLIKALGGRIFPVDGISILTGEKGRPYISATGQLEELLGTGKIAAHVSISHERGYAVAMVVLETAD